MGAVLIFLVGAGPAHGQPARPDSIAPPPPAFAGEPMQLPPPPGASLREPWRAVAPVTPVVAAAAPGTDGAPLRAAVADASLRFPAGSATLTPEAAVQLDRMAARLLSSPSERLELRAYAAPSGHGEGEARRLSLARALAVRSYLLDRGVEMRRLIVYALGSRGLEAADEPGRVPPGADRVDMSVTP